MKIEIWSDYACPFCYIGERRLEKAIAAANTNVEVVFRSFELDPTAADKVVSGTVERFAYKYGLSEVEAAERVEEISQMGRREGIDFKYSTTRYTNTFDALRLTKLAQVHGHNEIINKLFDAYFTKNLELANHDVLKKIAAECGLDADEVNEVLAGNKYAAEVRNDENQAARLGIHAVPCFVIDGKYMLSGAQPAAVIREAIEQAAGDNLSGMACGVDGCKFD